MTPSFARVPVVPQPPHDPTSLLLNGRIGWRTLWVTNVETDAVGALRLAPVSTSLPPFANAAGTFGNLVLPSNTAITNAGTILLLDIARATLRRFDPCACAFEDVPSIGGVGAPPRRWKQPRAIATCGGDLFVCDTSHERVAVYTLNGLAFRGDLRPPAAESAHWQPSAIAFDSQRHAFVTDQAAGLVHCFDARGVWNKALTGFSQPIAIAVDCLDRLFVVQTGASALETRVVDRDGQEITIPARADRLAGDFPTLPFSVDTNGNLRLGPLCRTGDDACGPAGPPVDWFDPAGRPMSVPPAQPAVVYTGTGEFVAGPLDSRTAHCVWHRVILQASVPDDAKVVVETFTADQPYTRDQLQVLAAWGTAQTARRVDRFWDCLVRSDPGRYLWLKLTLASIAGGTPVISEATVEFPRISLRRFLPAIFGAEPVSADFTDRFLALFDTTLRSIERQVDTEASLFDPLSTPAHRVNGARIDFLTWLGTWIGVALDRRVSEPLRRVWLKRAGRLFDRRGTVSGLREQLTILLGLDRYQRDCPPGPRLDRCCPPPPNCAPDASPIRAPQLPLILEHFKLRRWLHVGAGRLGSEAVLWGNRIANRSELDANAQVGVSQLESTQDPLRDPYNVFAHTFSVFVPCRYRESDVDRRALEAMLRAESPAHTRHRLVFVEPRFRVGVQSMIGFDAVVGAVPRGVRIGASPLGAASVLTTQKGPRPPFAVGAGRIGTTDRIG